LLLSVAAGVMLGATVFSLVLPAMEIVQRRGGSELAAALVTAGGVALGALAIWALHANVPHEHFVKGPEGKSTIQLGRNWLFILAITLHNFPEGLSVGVAYGEQASTGITMTLGIGLQNLPEGLAVAAALVGDGFGRARAFSIALMTGLVEPVGGLVGALAISASASLLPWALAFSGGAMLFVISGEVIPETHQKGSEHRATFSLVAGFIAMMLLDVAIA
jgi:ZIP family zinc transporter